MGRFLEGRGDPIKITAGEDLAGALNKLSPRSFHQPFPHNRLSRVEQQALEIVSRSTTPLNTPEGVSEFSITDGFNKWELVTEFGVNGKLITVEIHNRHHFDVIDAARGAHYRANTVREIRTPDNRTVTVVKGKIPLKG